MILQFSELKRICSQRNLNFHSEERPVLHGRAPGGISCFSIVLPRWKINGCLHQHQSLPRAMEESFKKLFVLMLYLAVQQLSPMLAVLNANDVEKYIITREGINDGDLYRIVYGNPQCRVHACGSSTGHLLDTTQCICSCMAVYPTFLPELGSCSDTETVKNSLLDGKYRYMLEDLIFVTGLATTDWCMIFETAGYIFRPK